MKCLSHLSRWFEACEPPTQDEIEQHVRRLNKLLLLYQRLKTMTATEWMSTQREIEMELQWFDIHRLKLTSTSSNPRLWRPTGPLGGGRKQAFLVWS